VEGFNGHDTDNAKSIKSVEPRYYEVVELLGLRVRNLPGHGYLFLLNVVFCQVEVLAMG
jgi:hypothetical protein